MTIGRESEMKKIEDVLCKSQDANILITGEPGVGKTTAIESLAYRIYIGRCHPLLAFKRLMDLNLEGILAQHTDMKVREEVLSRILQEAHAAGNIIIVIHRIDRYLSSGEGRIDLSTPIQKYLAQPGVQVIGITTPAAYERYIRPKAEVAQHFTQLPLQEIAPEVALQIILRNYYKYEKRYSVTLPYETCVAAVQKSAYFITTIPFPEKALQLLDDACVYVKNHVTEKVVKPTIIDTVLTTRLHVPTVVDDVLKQKLMSLEQDLGTHVIGQERALRLIAQALQRAFVMLGKRKKPLASFLLLGPTGVGKTETAKVLATHFFTDESSLIRFDMSQFQRVDDIPKLIGDTSTGDPGLLVSALRKQPYGVLLLDEIEKASKDLLNVFLTVMDEGYIADATGARVDCKSLIIIATSNAGALDFYHAASPDTRRGDGALMQFLIQNRYFSPEFLNRFDGVIAYEPLTTEVAVQIGTLMVHAIVKDIALLHGVTITVGEETIRRIVHDHFNPVYGARDLARAIKDSLETDIAQRILTGALKPGSAVTL
jgi:ATP-dependent Clp protease ATP-binding subunit ClpA